MSRSTWRSIGIGAGVGLLLLLVGTVSFMLARPDSETSTASASASSSTSTPSTTTTTAAQPAGSVLGTITSTLPPERDFSDLFDEFESAVGAANVITCDTARQGTAFLIEDDLAITSASLVADSTEIAVTFGDESVEAAVLGVDEVADIATLRLAQPADQVTVLELSEDPVRVGQQVGALTQPTGLPQTMIVGRVSSVDQGAPSPKQIRTDADVDAGSAGGPVIDERGRVVGVVGPLTSVDASDGPLTALSAPAVLDDVSRWIGDDRPLDGAFCVGSVDLDDIDAVAPELIAADIAHPELSAIQRTYAVYSQSINSSRAEQAFGVLGPAITRDNTPEAWAEGQRTSKLWDWRVRSIEQTTDGLEVRSLFTSTQDGEFGFDGASTCTRWDITHNLVQGDFRGQNYWLINRSRASSERGPVDCEAWVPEVLLVGEFSLGDTGGRVETEQLPGGTVHRWSVDLGLINANDPDEIVEQAEIKLEVSVDVGESFDPVIEIYNAAGRLVVTSGVAEGATNAEAEFAVSTNTTLDVHVRDAENRTGGEYAVNFRAVPIS